MGIKNGVKLFRQSLSLNRQGIRLHPTRPQTCTVRLDPKIVHSVVWKISGLPDVYHKENRILLLEYWQLGFKGSSHPKWWSEHLRGHRAGTSGDRTEHMVCLTAHTHCFKKCLYAEFVWKLALIIS